MTAIEIVDDDTFLGADNAFNMFVCTKDGYAIVYLILAGITLDLLSNHL
jgi:hypothetical protein